MEKQRIRNFWNKNNCMIVALKCNNTKEFQNKYSGAYKASLKNNWFKDITKHFTPLKNKKWNQKNCAIEAKKYKTKTEFKINSNGAYKAALKNNWLEIISSHMETKGSLYKRYNYIYEFPDNHVYIGLTYDINRRNFEHLNNFNSPVFQHINKNNLIPKLIVDDLKSAKDSQEKEIKLIEEYKINNWILLNKAIGGSLGKNNTKWNLEKCKEEALKYHSRLEFQKKSHTAYKFCLKNKIIDEVCYHMVKIKKNKPIRIPKYNFNICKEEALKYKTKKDFYTNSRNIYHYSSRNKYLKDICEHID